MTARVFISNFTSALVGAMRLRSRISSSAERRAFSSTRPERPQKIISIHTRLITDFHSRTRLAGVHKMRFLFSFDETMSVRQTEKKKTIHTARGGLYPIWMGFFRNGSRFRNSSTPNWFPFFTNPG